MERIFHEGNMMDDKKIIRAVTRASNLMVKVQKSFCKVPDDATEWEFQVSLKTYEHILRVCISDERKN